MNSNGKIASCHDSLSVSGPLAALVPVDSWHYQGSYRSLDADYSALWAKDVVGLLVSAAQAHFQWTVRKLQWEAAPPIDFCMILAI